MILADLRDTAFVGDSCEGPEVVHLQTHALKKSERPGPWPL